MDNLVYKSGDLFTATAGSILVHACNCQGTWGAGVADDFRRLFPMAYKSYRADCLKEGDTLRGQARLYMGLRHGEAYAVGCLFTSVGYGWNVDHPSDILDATLSAVETMVGIAKVQAMEIHSPKFNSGLFKIPWPETEERLKSVLENYPDVKWTVWTGKA